MKLSNAKLWHQVSALFIFLFGAFVIWEGSRYRLGVVSNIGPGFFPIVIGIIISLLALFVVIENVKSNFTSISVSVRPLVMVTASILAFALTIERFGIVPAAIVVSLFAAYADRRMRIIPFVMLVSFILFITSALFYYAFRIPVPLFKVDI